LTVNKEISCKTSCILASLPCKLDVQPVLHLVGLSVFELGVGVHEYVVSPDE